MDLRTTRWRRRAPAVLCGMLSLLLAMAWSAPARADRPIPFSPGEKLTFLLRWGVIPAGEATLEVHPPQDLDGEPAQHFVLTARTNSFVDIFYKVRQRIDAFSDLSMNRSLLYKEVHTVHRTRRNAQIVFDWESMQARYINFGKEEPPVSLDPGTFDPLSVFYYSRLFDPASRRILERPVTDGKKCVVGRATIVGRETIEVQEKTYDTFLVEPELKEVGGVFKKSKDARIQVWVTADNRRIPVRLKSKVVIGSFTGDLVSVERPAGDDRRYFSRR